MTLIIAIKRTCCALKTPENQHLNGNCKTLIDFKTANTRHLQYFNDVYLHTLHF